jgi:hypothetical protein
MHITVAIFTLKMANVMCTGTMDKLQHFTRLNPESQNCTREQLCCMWMWLYFVLLHSNIFQVFFDSINICCFFIINALRAWAVRWVIKTPVDLEISVSNKSNKMQHGVEKHLWNIWIISVTCQLQIQCTI